MRGSWQLGTSANKPRQVMAIDWLLQESIEGPDLASGPVLGCADEDQHRRSVAPTLLTDLRRQRQAVCVRHFQVDQDRVEVRVGQKGASLGRRCGRIAEMPEPLRYVAE